MSQLAQAQLDAAYRYCRKLNAEHGRTFYLATALLPAASRPHVHALYGFARYADDLVDRPDPGSHPIQRLDSLDAEVRDVLSHRAIAKHPVVRAMAATVGEHAIDHRLVTDFLASMRADLTVARYRTFADLQGYMWGSAAVIGLQMLPILGVAGDAERARSAAIDLGIAFQLTNFIRDIGEDYRRGRIYLPGDSLAEFGVSDEMFGRREVGPAMKALLRSEIARARGFYASAEAGIDELSPTSRDCVRTAWTLYSAILTQIERADYQVLSHRAAVPLGRRLLTGGTGYIRAVRTRLAR